MSIVIFLGPTLPVEEARKELDAVYLPPAAQGDVYLAARDKPVAIGLIDGVFDQRPAVAHKEVLYAMSEGIHVLGAASMGALRAVELSPFGMEGHGDVFDAFQCGELTCDDEVAVAHASAEEGYRPLSEAMVNVRATISAAKCAGVLDAASAEATLSAARALFYTERCWPLILRKAAERGVALPALDALQGFLPKGRVDRKRLDALTLLRAMKQRFSGPVAPKRVDHAFERTDAWEHVRKTAEARRDTSSDAGRPAAQTAMLRLLAEEGALEAALQGALGRALAIDFAQRQGRAVEGAALADAIEAFRCSRGLYRPEDMVQWVADNDLRDPERFFRAEALIRWARTVGAAEAERHLWDHLRSTGRFAALRARACQGLLPPA